VSSVDYGAVVMNYILGIVGCIGLCACTATQTSTQTQQQSSVPSTSDVQQCEAATRRILATPHYDENLIGALYGPRLRFLLLRGLNAEPGTDHWINWDYVYETQDDMPSVLSVGPGRADGDRIVVPVLMLRPWATPARKTKTWIFKRFNGQWLVDEVIDLDGQSLTRVLDNP